MVWKIVLGSIGGFFALVGLIVYIKAWCSAERERRAAVRPIARQRINDGNTAYRLVQIFMPVRAANGFYAQFEKVLSVVGAKGKLVEDRSNLDTKLPLIVVCPITSSLDSDIDAALSGIELSNFFLTVVVHYGREDSVPWLTPSAISIQREKFRQTVFVDMAYTVEEGITLGPRNKKTIISIAAFVDSVYDTRN